MQSKIKDGAGKVRVIAYDNDGNVILDEIRDGTWVDGHFQFTQPLSLTSDNGVDLGRTQILSVDTNEALFNRLRLTGSPPSSSSYMVKNDE